MLAALQSISPSLYEAAHVEGAGGFEKFWLITFPMCSSALLLCLIYSIIDSFVAYNNPIVLLTQQMTVSYTHLDVYKRQPIFWALLSLCRSG